MKTTTILLSIIFCLKLFAVESILTNSEEEILLQDLDNICADTWCEGDFDFSFNDLGCFEDGSCKLSLTFIYYDWQESGELYSELPNKKFLVPVVCEMGGFRGKEDIIEGNSKSSDFLFDQVTECIDKNSDSVYEEISEKL